MAPEDFDTNGAAFINSGCIYIYPAVLNYIYLQLYLYISGCIYISPAVFIYIRLYLIIYISGCTYISPAVFIYLRLYLYISGCIYIYPAVFIYLWLYLYISGCTYISLVLLNFDTNGAPYSKHFGTNTMAKSTAYRTTGKS